jgi:hypothetical protein
MSAPDEDCGDGSPINAVSSHGIIEDFYEPRFVVSQKNILKFDYYLCL